LAIETIVFFEIALLLEGRTNFTSFSHALASGYAAVAVIAGLLGMFIYAGGLFIPGIFVWAWLHQHGKRSYLSAALAAGVGSYVICTLVSAGSGWRALLLGLWAFLPGIAAGLVVRALAYDPVK
jgi:hypothetical protein